MPIRKIISAGLGLAASFSLCHAAMTNEPTEFRGIGWGAPIEDHQKELASLSSRGDVAFYRCPADQLSWGGAEIQKISYRYFKGRFSGSTLQLFGASHKKAITAKMSSYTARRSNPTNAYHNISGPAKKPKLFSFAK